METVVGGVAEAMLSTADAGQEVGSFTRRTSDRETMVVAEREEKELLKEGGILEEEHRRIHEEMGVEMGEDKTLKSTDVNFNSLKGVKRKDEAMPIDESRLQEPTKRQRRWNSEYRTGASTDSTIPTTTSHISKDMVHLEISEIAQAPSTSSTPKVTASTNFESPAPSRLVLSRTEFGMNGEMDKKRHVPPPLRSPTVSLKIDRFVRPFTIKAVRELLEETGTVKEMWMDQIKTHCYVTYPSVDEAIATRNALYHLQWPVAGGKLLIAEFVEPEEVKLRVDGVNGKSTAATPVSTPRGSGNSSAQGISRVGLIPSTVPAQTTIIPAPLPPPLPVRERSGLPPNKEQELPIPTLDDLFKKTRTKPQIYFLPLTEEQVAAKLRNKQALSEAPVNG